MPAACHFVLSRSAWWKQALTDYAANLMKLPLLQFHICDCHLKTSCHAGNVETNYAKLQPVSETGISFSPFRFGST